MNIKKVSLFALLVLSLTLFAGCGEAQEDVEQVSSTIQIEATESQLPLIPGDPTISGGPVNPEQPSDVQPEDEDQIDEEVAEKDSDEDTDENTGDYIGTWGRTGTYLNGEMIGAEPATLTLNIDSYASSAAACSSQGGIKYMGDSSILMSQTSTNCVNVPQSLNVTYKYTIVEDEDRNVQVMTIVTGPVTETYDRQS